MIPVVGSLLNWWSPPAADAVPRGRSFNLASGECVNPAGHLNYLQ